MSIPTLKLIKDKELIGNFVGAMSSEELEDWLDERIQSADRGDNNGK